MKKYIHGGDVYTHQGCLDFSANCNPLGTPQSVKEAVIRSLDGVSCYPQVGCGPLKEAIARYEGTEADSVICGNGAADLIFSLCRARMPKRALLPAPTFGEYEQALTSVGCEVEYFSLREEEGFVLKEGFLEALHRKLDMVFLCNPNNPTGILMEREFLFQVLRVCRDLNILLVVDECFLDFVKEPEAYTLKAQLSRYHNLFLLKAFTKRYAMAGIRLGYGLCENRELLERMELATQPWNVSSLAQAAGIAALKEREYVREGREIVFSEAEYLKRELRSLGLTVYPSAANYIFFRGPENLWEACLEKRLLLRDCSNYPGLCRGYYRIAVKLPRENRRLIGALKEILCS